MNKKYIEAREKALKIRLSTKRYIASDLRYDVLKLIDKYLNEYELHLEIEDQKFIDRDAYNLAINVLESSCFEGTPS